MAISIREIVANDTDAIVALWRSVFPEYFDPTKPQRAPGPSIDRKLAFDDGLFWLAENERGEILGTVMAGYDGHRGWIYSIGVHPSARGSGLAQDLLAHAERALHARGCIKVNLQVGAGNARALAFYEKTGYANDDVTSLGKRL
jgi:ribosomal protein S18 acetylase RimI-like enzyme